MLFDTSTRSGLGPNTLVEIRGRDHALTNFEDVLPQLRERIARYTGSRQINEQNTKATLIDPMLRVLGWNTEDIDEVHREYKVKSADKPVDYALLVLRTPKLFLEAKSLGERLDDRRWGNQIMGYAAVAGVEWVVLTDGDEYRIYNSHAPVPIDEKLFRCIRVRNDSPITTETLELLSKERMNENSIQMFWQAQFVDRQVRTAMEDLISTEADSALIELLHNRLPSLSTDDIRAALGRARVTIDFPSVGIVETTPAHHPIWQEPRQREVPRMDSSEVTLRLLIKHGFIHPPLELENHTRGHHLTAQIQDDGTVLCVGNRYDSLSRAAGMALMSINITTRGQKWAARNGWVFWQFKDDDGRLQPIDVLRKRYLNHM